MPSVKILSPAMATTLEELGEGEEREGGTRAGHKRKKCVCTEERTAPQTTQVQGGHVPLKSSNISPLDLDLCSPRTAGRTTEDVNPSFCSPLISTRAEWRLSLLFAHESPHLKRTWFPTLSWLECALKGGFFWPKKIPSLFVFFFFFFIPVSWENLPELIHGSQCMNFQSGISRIFQCGSSFVNLASVASVVGKGNVNRKWSLGQWGLPCLFQRKS